jgi:hypothetical protein
MKLPAESCRVFRRRRIKNALIRLKKHTVSKKKISIGLKKELLKHEQP